MIRITNLYYKYEDRYILKNINLKIKEGDFIAIIGANGSGKTTLIKHLNALLLPTKGEVVVDDLNTKKDFWEIRQKVGIVFQNPEDQLINSIVEEDIAFGLENLGLPTEEIQLKVKEVLKNLNIKKLAKENVNNLSFGQKQLVALAGILVMKPKYVVFDEPTTMLDPKNRFNIMRIINRSTIILVTNNLEDIKNVKDVVLLKDGKIMFNGKKENLTVKILKKADMHE
jgi:energy-coupling factor transport system ATP-binding protein